MNKADALEAAPIVQRCCKNLMNTIATHGREGSDARTQIGDTIAYAYTMLRDNSIGPELDQCFTLARQAGATFVLIEQVRRFTSQETPTTLGGAMTQNCLVQWCLATEAEIISNMDFISRQDVDKVKQQIKDPFQDAIELAADDMDQMVFQGLVNLYGATVNYLVDTQRPLPQMLNYEFSRPNSTLVIAYRLYGDAGRADQVRQENKIIHPAFAPAAGQALSA
jgi:prophage DNA circulation protein